MKTLQPVLPYWLLRLRIFSFFHCLQCWMLVIVRKTKLKYLTNKRCQISERYVRWRQLLFRSEFRSQSSKNYPRISLKNSWKIPEKFLKNSWKIPKPSDSCDDQIHTGENRFFWKSSRILIGISIGKSTMYVTLPIRWPHLFLWSYFSSLNLMGGTRK